MKAPILKLHLEGEDSFDVININNMALSPEERLNLREMLEQ